MNNELVLKGNVGAISFIDFAPGKMFVAVSLYVTESLGKNEAGKKEYKKTLFHTIGFGNAAEQLKSLNIQRGDFIKLEGAVTPDEKTAIRIRKASIIKSRVANHS